ncbi:MAG: acylphosphatase [candidate division KSB1 bacterium]|nr:acylphosphatase [candidate division KSB1 bacterium]MDZ7294218.1 acylphosphatase [candidate division KSB1 bacterium]MDZ7384492.1 acylphosphatase [candidate division KSB1 bacterium]MDZ7392102.1 acylphosphatase [candidate division KSB1 bacterium]MDZ7412693.1 acylphosphatase [candidate division KSB1 bacterium]
MKVRAVIVVRGMVQGVGFRHYAYRQAKALGLVGYVRNQWDGSVLSEVEGERGMVEEYIKALTVGPRFSSVRDVQVKWEEYTGEFTYFEIAF